MTAGTFPLKDAVRPIRIRHHLERNIIFDQLVDDSFRALIVDVIIARAVYHEQIAYQTLGVGQRRSVSGIRYRNLNRSS